MCRAGFSGVFVAMWALLRVVEGAGIEVVTEAQDLIPAVPINLVILDAARAVLDARCGDRGRATARVAATDAAMRSVGLEGWRHLVLRLVAEPALVDGWGDPVAWLTDVGDYFERRGLDRVAAVCRDFLRRAGHTPVRHGKGRVPPPLRARGVTDREMDVLDLVGERLANREIAARLYLSPRTVEKHVERLLHKTGVADRAELGRLARRVGGAPSART
jgi:DNA-binding CsgD family transcriptional regulator